MKNNIFRTKFDTATIVLIPACIGINFIGKFFAQALKLPLWLDSIGTCIAACLGGPVIGGISGALNNIIYGLVMGDSISIIYALSSLFIGFFVGVMARSGFMQTFPKALITSLVAALAAIVVSTPLNIIFWGGQTGNIWGDAVFAAAQAASIPLWLSSFFDEVIVDVPDKIVTLILVFIIVKSLPEKLTSLYAGSDEIERLDQ